MVNPMNNPSSDALKAIREALEFYSREWKNDSDMPSPCTEEPTNALISDIGKKAADALSCLSALESLVQEKEKLKRVVLLVGAMFFHNGFMPETGDELELEELLREHGAFFETMDELKQALQTPSGTAKPSKREG